MPATASGPREGSEITSATVTKETYKQGRGGAARPYPAAPLRVVAGSVFRLALCPFLPVPGLCRRCAGGQDVRPRSVDREGC